MDEGIVEIVTRNEAVASGLKYFFTGKPCKRGHISQRYARSGGCQECCLLRQKRDYQESRGIRIAQAADYRRSNAEIIRLRDAERRERDREKRRAKDAAYREKNKQIISKKHVELRRRRRHNDSLFAVKHSIRGLIGGALSRRGFGKTTKTAEILGCTWEEFAAHIERQFLPGMSWDNRPTWHIDHIVPIATARTEREAISLNHVSNLRPVWSADNMAKSDKILFLI